MLYDDKKNVSDFSLNFYCVFLIQTSVSHVTRVIQSVVNEMEK